METPKISKIMDDNGFTLGDIKYEFLKFTHKDRRAVFAYFSSVKNKIIEEDFSFLDSDGWDKIEENISKHISIGGKLLVNLPTHFEEHPKNYVPFVLVALSSICDPFLGESHID